MRGTQGDIFDVDCCGRKWMLQRSGDLESLWEAMTEKDFGDDERLPYWAEVWPASIVLGEWISTQGEALNRKRCLDLGCGLGLTAVVAASCGARVLAMDYEWAAVSSSQRNMQLNGVRFQPVQMDWRSPAFRKGSFPYVIGGDILYEERFAEPVARFLDHVLAPEGRVWIAEPSRQPSKFTWKKLAELGFEVRIVREETIPWKGYPVSLFVRELCRT